MSKKTCPSCGAVMEEAEGAIPSMGTLHVTSSGKYWICLRCGLAVK